MTIASEIEKLQENLADSYTAVSGKGGTLPENENFDNLPDAIDSIPASSEPVIESLSITPSTSSQTITASGGTDGYSPISVDAVTNSIDENITAGNIVSGVSILGVTGTATELNGDTLSVTPSTSAQVLTPTSPKNGFTQVNVSAVTSSIDANIQAGNIKKDVEILGVTGTFAGGGEYSGLTTHYNGGNIVKIDGGSLSDYLTVDGTEIALANGTSSYGKDRLIKSGNIVDTNGVFSNFNKYDYVALPTEIDVTKPWSVVLKTVSAYNGPLLSYYRFSPDVGSTEIFYLSLNTSFDCNYGLVLADGQIKTGGFAKVFSLNSTATLKFEYTGSDYRLYSLIDGVWILNGIIDFSSPLREDITSLYFGRNRNGNWLSSGSIDLTAVKITSNDRVLWDYETTIFYNKDNIGIYGKEVPQDFNIVGGILIQDNGIASGFVQNTSYVMCNNTMPSTISQFKMITKGRIRTGATNHSTIMSRTVSPTLTFTLRNSNYFSIYTTGWTQGVTLLSRETWYWFGIELDGGVYKGYVLEDNGYTLETLPEFSQWNLEWTNALTGLMENAVFTFGSTFFYGGEDVNGWMDIGQTLIQVNNETLCSWSNKSIQKMSKSVKGNKLGVGDSALEITYNIYYNINSTPYENRLILDNNVISDDNYVPAGTATIPAHTTVTGWVSDQFEIVGSLKYVEDENGVGFTGFSNSNYIKSNCLLFMNVSDFTSGFESCFHIKTDSNFNGEHFICSCSTNNSYGLNMEIESGPKIWSTIAGDSFRYMTLSGSAALQPNTEYWIRIYKEVNADTLLQYSTDKTAWTTVASSSTTPSGGIVSQVRMIIGAKADLSTDYSFRGGIIYDDSFIKVGNNTVWSMKMSFVPDPI